jgi:ribosomal protein S18 acetylase RimI-like enzyme
MDIRVLRPSDIPHVQLANITNLPENYFCKYYLYHAMSWPQLSYVAVDVSLYPSIRRFESKMEQGKELGDCHEEGEKEREVEKKDEQR